MFKFLFQFKGVAALTSPKLLETLFWRCRWLTNECKGPLTVTDDMYYTREVPGFYSKHVSSNHHSQLLFICPCYSLISSVYTFDGPSDWDSCQVFWDGLNTRNLISIGGCWQSVTVTSDALDWLNPLLGEVLLTSVHVINSWNLSFILFLQNAGFLDPKLIHFKPRKTNSISMSGFVGAHNLKHGKWCYTFSLVP